MRYAGSKNEADRKTGLSQPRSIFHKEYPKDVRIEFLSSEYSLDRMEENGALLLHSIRADLVC